MVKKTAAKPAAAYLKVRAACGGAAHIAPVRQKEGRLNDREEHMGSIL